MCRLPGAGFGKVQSMQDARQFRIVCREKNQAAGFCAQRLCQCPPAFGVSRPYDHQAAFRQGSGHANWIGQAVIVCHEGQQPGVEAGGGSC